VGLPTELGHGSRLSDRLGAIHPWVPGRSLNDFDCHLATIVSRAPRPSRSQSIDSNGLRLACLGEASDQIDEAHVGTALPQGS
jgi:hypothetical protein